VLRIVSISSGTNASAGSCAVASANFAARSSVPTRRSVRCRSVSPSRSAISTTEKRVAGSVDARGAAGSFRFRPDGSVGY
jgi:hypothetical protein